MAYINTDVYQNGLTNSILNGEKTNGNGTGYTVVVLTSSASLTTLTTDSILAVSEARLCKDGDNTSDELTGGAVTEVTNHIGSYSVGSKQLNIDAIPYCRTKTIKPGTANGFAVVYISEGSPTSQTAYTKIVDGVSQNVNFAGFDDDVIVKGQVIISGALNSNVTLNNDSNFMFGGAVINFTEA